MKLLLDTNVILDALLDRAPWADDAKAILTAGAIGEVEPYVTSNCVTDIYYIARGKAGRDAALQVVRKCLDQVNVLDVTGADLEAAHALDGPDFEDDRQIVCAVATSMDGIVTRDKHGFADSPIPVRAPAEVVARLR